MKQNNKIIPKNSQKRLKLKYLLENIKITTTPEGTNSIETNFENRVPCFDKSRDISADFSIYFSLLEKPINLLFSMDQLFFEFSKKSVQQKKISEFFQQLKERKKLGLFYGLGRRKSLVNVLKKAKKIKGCFSKNILCLLEQRLDVVLYRSGLTKTISQARQLIIHKKVFVNHKPVHFPTYLLQPGDFLSIAPQTIDANSCIIFNHGNQELHKKSEKQGVSYVKGNKNSGVDNVKFLNSIDDSLKPGPMLWKSDMISRNINGKSDTIDKVFHPFQDFYSKLKIKNMSCYEYFPSRDVCTFLIRLLCTQIKCRSSLKTNCPSRYHKVIRGSLFSIFIRNGNENAYQIENGVSSFEKFRVLINEKKILALLKRFTPNTKSSKKFVRNKQFQIRRQSNLSTKTRHLSTKGSFVEVGGKFPKKQPRFWSRSFMIYKHKKKIGHQRVGSAFKGITIPFRHKPDIKIVDFAKQQTLYKSPTKSILCKSINGKKDYVIKRYRNFFLKFLRFLNNCTKWSGLLDLNIKKSLYKKSFKSPVDQTMGIIKPMHLEVSYKLLNAVYLYSPQRIHFPFSLDLDVINRSLN